MATELRPDIQSAKDRISAAWARDASSRNLRATYGRAR